MFRAVAYFQNGGDIHGEHRKTWREADDDLIGFIAAGCLGGTVEQWNDGMRAWCLCESDPMVKEGRG